MTEAELTSQDANAPATTEGKYVYLRVAEAIAVTRTVSRPLVGGPNTSEIDRPTAENAELRRRLDAEG